MYILMYLYILYMCIFICAITIDEKRGREFEGESRGVHGRFWREEKEWRNVIKTTIPKINKQKKIRSHGITVFLKLCDTTGTMPVI